MSRPVVALLLALLLALGLCACTVPPAPTATPTPTAAPTEAPEPTGTAAPTPTPTEEPEPPETPAPDPDTTLTAIWDDDFADFPAYTFRGDLTGDGRGDFTLVLPAELTAEFSHNAWVIRPSEGEAFLELSFIAGTDAETLLPGLLDAYLDFTEIEFDTEPALGSLRGEIGCVRATGDGTDAEGWLADVSGGVISAVLVCPERRQAFEGNLLRAVLNTLTLL